MQENGDWNLLKWTIGLLGSMLSGAAVGGWVARGLLEELKHRVELLERDQKRCQATLKEDFRAIVQSAVDHQSICYTEHLQAIRTELAVMTALHGETQKDVQALFERSDRRRQEFVPNPHGERRDQI